MGSDYFDCCVPHTNGPCLGLRTGYIENWRLGPEGDDVRTSPYFTVHRSSPNFNKLFAALYDVIFSKLTKMGRLIPGAGRPLRDIFKEKIPGTERHLVSEELIAYLSWLIYVAAFKDKTGLQHEAFYNTKVAYLKAAAPRWRSDLFIELQAWYDQYPASKKRSRSSASGPVEEVLECVRTYNMDDADNFVDPLEDAPAAMGREAAAAAAALAAAAPRPGAGAAAAAAAAAPPAAGGAGAV